MVTLRTANLKAAFPDWYGGINEELIYGFIPLETSLAEFVGQAAVKGLKVERDQDQDNPLSNILSLYPPLRNRVFVTVFEQGNYRYQILIGENPLDESDPRAYVADQDFNFLRLVLISQGE